MIVKDYHECAMHGVTRRYRLAPVSGYRSDIGI
jgi:hypothetical protein